jgi:SNF2 family DNA or RNA helicase
LPSQPAPELRIPNPFYPSSPPHPLCPSLSWAAVLLSQTIALTWTLLKQSPTPGAAAASKAIVVCPSSLVGNWRAEFKRWLGDERCRPLAVRGTGSEAAAQISDFMAGSAGVHPVLIVSYEMLRKHVELVRGRR